MIDPVVLAGPRVRLEPLAVRHAPELYEVVSPEVFAHLPYPAPTDVPAMERWISDALALRDQGVRTPFAIVHADAAVGTTSYWYHDRQAGHLEIGSTWIADRLWGTGLNREAKELLIRHAFDVLGCAEVRFRTDLANTRSQRAIEALGAVRTRVVPRDLQRADGTWRTSVHYALARQSR